MDQMSQSIAKNADGLNSHARNVTNAFQNATQQSSL